MIRPSRKKRASQSSSPGTECPSQSSSASNGSMDKSDLRMQLSSVAWVQCDNTECLKWRKVAKEVAEDLGEDDPWTCAMNEDPAFKSCSVPEEDTAAFDKLAKSARLELIKSELKQGALVWAKIDGFCRWPGLITDDPLSGDHTEGDEEEVFHYHVEFLGGERSHGWVRAERVEVFGAGNSDLLENSIKSQSCSKNEKKKGIKKRKGKFPTVKKVNLKKTYKGVVTVQSAVTEALSLLPLSTSKRLETCWFVQKQSSRQGSLSVSEVKKKTLKALGDITNVKHDRNKRQRSLKKEEKPKLSTADTHSSKSELHACRKKNGKAPKRKQKENVCDGLKKVKESKAAETVEVKLLETSCEASGVYENRGDTKKQPKGLGCLHFPSSLIGSSKEERFILDVQMYMRNEKAFEEDVTRFMSRQRLSLSSPPVWQHVKVSIFSIFLAVYERGGFELVCDNRHWGSVYNEVAHQQTGKGGNVVKRFYQRNLYAYELYVTGQDYSLAVRALQRQPKKKKAFGGSTCSLDNSSQDCSSVSLKHCDDSEEDEDEDIPEDDDDKNQDFSGKIETLDEILLILGQEEQVSHDHQVPDLRLPIQPAASGLDLRAGGDLELKEEPRGEQVDTGSGGEAAVEPDEKAQVVPELDFPSSVESSEPSNDLHEMQALQLDMGDLDNLIDIL